MNDLTRYAPPAAATIACKLVKALLAEGWTISVYDSEEYTVKRSTSYKAITEALASTEGDILAVRNDGQLLGKIWLIWENDEDVISDYSCGDLEPIINAIN